MKNIIISFLILSQLLHASQDNSPFGQSDMAPAAQADISISSESSEEEELSVIAINTFSNPQYRHSNFNMMPYVKRLLEEVSSHQNHPDRDILNELRRKARQNSFNNDFERDNAPSPTDLKIQRILLEASQKALEEKEEELAQKAQYIAHQKQKLDAQISKSSGALVTVATSLISGGVTAIGIYFSNACGEK